MDQCCFVHVIKRAFSFIYEAVDVVSGCNGRDHEGSTRNSNAHYQRPIINGAVRIGAIVYRGNEGER